MVCILIWWKKYWEDAVAKEDIRHFNGILKKKSKRCLLLFPLFPIGCPSHSDHFSRDPTAEESVVKNEKHADRDIKLKKGNMPVYSFYIKFSYWNIMGNRNTLPFVVFKHQCNYAPLWNFILNSLGKHKAPVWIITDNTQFTKNRKVMQGRIWKISNLKQPSAFYGCSTFIGCWAPLRKSCACFPSFQNSQQTIPSCINCTVIFPLNPLMLYFSTMKLFQRTQTWGLAVATLPPLSTACSSNPALQLHAGLGLPTYSFPLQASSPATQLYRHVWPGSIWLQRQAPAVDSVQQSHCYLRCGGLVSARR